MDNLQRQLEEYRALPSADQDLTARLLWGDANPPPALSRICKECGRHLEPFQLTWDDVVLEVEAGRPVPEELLVLCDRCEPVDEEEDEEEDEDQ